MALYNSLMAQKSYFHFNLRLILECLSACFSSGASLDSLVNKSLDQTLSQCLIKLEHISGPDFWHFADDLQKLLNFLQALHLVASEVLRRTRHVVVIEGRNLGGQVLHSVRVEVLEHGPVLFQNLDELPLDLEVVPAGGDVEQDLLLVDLEFDPHFDRAELDDLRDERLLYLGRPVEGDLGLAIYSRGS